MTTLVPAFLYGSSPFLQVARTTIKAWMSLNFCKNLSLKLTIDIKIAVSLKKGFISLY